MHPPFLLVVSGVPGAGKSTISRFLAGLLGCRVFEISTLARALGVARRDPSGRDTEVIEDFSALARTLRGAVDEGCGVLASHILWPLVEDLGDLVPAVLLLRVNPRVLLARLERRGWRPGKVAENVLAEVFGVLWDEVEGVFDAVFEVDATGKGPDEVVDEFLGLVRKWRPGRRVDWLGDPGVVELAARLSQLIDSSEYGLG